MVQLNAQNFDMRLPWRQIHNNAVLTNTAYIKAGGYKSDLG